MEINKVCFRTKMYINLQLILKTIQSTIYTTANNITEICGQIQTQMCIKPENLKNISTETQCINSNEHITPLTCEWINTLDIITFCIHLGVPLLLELLLQLTMGYEYIIYNNHQPIYPWWQLNCLLFVRHMQQQQTPFLRNVQILLRLADWQSSVQIQEALKSQLLSNFNHLCHKTKVNWDEGGSLN